MHRKPQTVADHVLYPLLALLAALTVVYLARHALTTLATVEYRGTGHVTGWIWTEVHPHAEFGRTGWLAIGERNPLVDWSFVWGHGLDLGAWGHRVGFGSYGGPLWHPGPNGGMYIELFGHSYGWELWGHVGPFMNTD